MNTKQKPVCNKQSRGLATRLFIGGKIITDVPTGSSVHVLESHRKK